MKKNNNAVKILRGAKTKNRALEMRIAGHGTMDIAEQLGISQRHVARLIQDGLQEIRESNVELSTRLRDIELETLSKVQPVFFSQAVLGDVPSLIAMLKIMERRAKLVGLDAQEDSSVAVTIKGYECIDISAWKEGEAQTSDSNVIEGKIL